MHILLTDILRCPRCGPEFGLILLADRIEDRRVAEGRLGCANCRRTYVVHAGVADLRHPESPPLELEPLEVGDLDETAFRVAALLGVQDPGATVLTLVPDAEIARRIAATLSESHIVAGLPDPGITGDESGEGTGMLSGTAHGTRFPFATAAFHAVGVVGSPSRTVLTEVSRVLRHGGRLVIEGAVPGTSSVLSDLGYEVDLSQDRTVVAGVRDRR